MHLIIPSMLEPCFLILRRPLTHFCYLAIPTKWLNWSSPLHMFNLFFPTIETDHSPFALPISTPLADKLMLVSHRDQCWDPGYTNFAFMVSLHIRTLCWQHVWTTLPSWLATKTLTICTFTCKHTFLILWFFFIKLRIQVNPNKSQDLSPFSTWSQ